MFAALLPSCGLCRPPPPAGCTEAALRRSHLDIAVDDPAVGAQFSVETLRKGDAGKLRDIPSMVHGAPTTAAVSELLELRGSERRPGLDLAALLQESREVLQRLRRMAGFESQNFDPVVRPTTWPVLRAERCTE